MPYKLIKIIIVYRIIRIKTKCKIYHDKIKTKKKTKIYRHIII